MLLEYLVAQLQIGNDSGAIAATPEFEFALAPDSVVFMRIAVL